MAFFALLGWLVGLASLAALIFLLIHAGLWGLLLLLIPGLMAAPGYIAGRREGRF